MEELVVVPREVLAIDDVGDVIVVRGDSVFVTGGVSEGTAAEEAVVIQTGGATVATWDVGEAKEDGGSIEKSKKQTPDIVDNRYIDLRNILTSCCPEIQRSFLDFSTSTRVIKETTQADGCAPI